MSLTKCWNFSHGKTLESICAIISEAEMCFTKSGFFILSFNYWYLMSMCFDPSLTILFLDRAIHPWVSFLIHILKILSTVLSTQFSFLIYNASLTANDDAIYLASAMLWCIYILFPTAPTDRSIRKDKNFICEWLPVRPVLTSIWVAILKYAALHSFLESDSHCNSSPAKRKHIVCTLQGT